MSAYEGSKMQEEDEKRKKYSSNEAVKLAVKTVTSMGIQKAHEDEIKEAFRDGYNQAINDIKSACLKLKSPI